MLVINIKEARKEFSRLIERAEHGEEIVITRRGRKVVRMEHVSSAPKRLPTLSGFRKGIAVSGTSLTSTLLRNRRKARW